MKWIVYILCILVSVNSLYPQNANKIDSIVVVLEHTHTVKEKIALYFELSGLYREVDLDTSRIILEYALQLAKETKSEKDIAEAYVILGNIDVMEDSLDQAILNYNNSIDYFKELNKLHQLSDVLVILGNIAYVKGNYSEAMRLYSESLTVTLESNYNKKLPHCYNNLGVVYHSQKDFTKALDFFSKALSLFEEQNDSLYSALMLGNIGSIYVELNNTDIAKNYFLNAMNKYELLGDDDGIALSLLQLSEIYIYNNQPDSALMLINRSNNLYQNLGFKYRGPKSFRYVDANIKAAKCYILKEEWRNAIIQLKKSIKTAQASKLNGAMMETAKLLSRVYDSLKIIDSSYLYFKLFKSYSDSLLNEDNIRNLAQIEFEYSYNQDKIEAELREKTKLIQENRKNLIYTISLAILVFTIILFVLLLKFEKTKKAKINIERNQLKKELEYKNKELTTHMLYLLKKNEFILSIGEKLKKIIPSIKVQNKKSIADIINELNAGSSDDTWKEFEIRFQEVHTSFFDNLNMEYPGLSPNELRLCAFLRLNMTTKDIAAITYQSTNSLEMARFRLRKKLGIDKDEHLVSFLSRL